MKTVLVDGIELSLVDRGSGPPVVLVHGFPLDHTMWDAQIDALATSYRVIAPDLRGFGRSRLDAGVLRPGATITIERFADDLAEMLDALDIDEPVTLCGLSMGGYIAMEFYRKYRSRLGKLALLDTRSENDTPEMAAGRREMAERVLCEGPEPLVDGMTPRLFAEATVVDRPEIVEQLRRVMLGNRPNAIAAALLGMAERANMTAMLGTIDCPTLVLVGELDAISTAEEMRSIADEVPNCRFEKIAGSGHMSTMEKPAEVNAILLDFLAEV
ncbi:MAG TPA: alpha/beta fold hydrolase [Thermoguttaceae bacterium]|nr:alpha/beta fold hydrolase [Thermoguttaceae bacterium]